MEQLITIIALILAMVPLSSVAMSQNNRMFARSSKKNHLFIFGLHGNLGSKIAQECISSSYFDSVGGSVRSFHGDSPFGSGIPLEENNRAEIQSFLRNATHVLVTIPPIQANYEQNNTSYRNIILDNQNDDGEDYSKSIRSGSWVGFISTTGVYGDHGGEWVNESSEARALVGSKAKAFLDTEEQWRQCAIESGFDLSIFRCAGLYSNNASALHTVLKHGVSSISGSSKVAGEDAVESYTSRIHIDDVARAIISSMNKHTRDIENQELFTLGDSSTEVYNLADDLPAPRSQVMTYARNTIVSSHDHYRILKSAHSFGKADSIRRSSERSSRRSRENKRIQNAKMKKDLLPDGKLVFPTYREGLEFILTNSPVLGKAI